MLVILLGGVAFLDGCERKSSILAVAPTEPAARARNVSQQTVLPGARSPSDSLPDFSWLVKRYGAAVVNVNVVGRADQASGSPQSAPDDPLSDFFRRFGIPEPGGPGTRGDSQERPLLRAQGSGFIVSQDGYVLTNAHVVSQASSVTVKLPDRREFPAKVIGADRRSDVALLKIAARNLPVVQPGNPAQVEPGQWVAAIGSPFGFENSVTVGVVSATARALGPQSSLVPFIQTDVAVNPGNSGGPLFNLRGEVIGINSQIYSATGGYQGLSFAIPINVALDVQRQLIASGHVTRGRIGIAIQDVDASLAQAFKLDRPRGALVSSIEPDGPAARAGIKPGDVVLSVNGTPVETSAELPPLIATLRPGSDAVFAVWRNGRQMSIKVPVAELQDEEGESARATNGGGDSGGAGREERLGLTVRPLTPQERRQLATDGRLVIEEAEGPAAAAGLQSGDIVLAVGNRPVRSLEELRRLTAAEPASVAFLVQRQDQQIYVPVRVDSQPNR